MSARTLLCIGLTLLLSTATAAQETPEGIAFGSAEDAIREAKQSKMPLVIFGMSDT